ncbi:CHAT domain-containing protein [Nonomuraea sp. JJY05]|uniref:CHAT domain-containing protein n=1 Tax=Nonomuraea sp. JJY05 TaxID=3350255 RepID=UPI00373F62F8
MPVTPDAPPLPGALAETERLAALLPRSRILLGPQATRASVTAALRDHPVAHFACHGLSNWANPAASALILHDHAIAAALTVEDLWRLHLTGADLAYLSACDTTSTSLRMADEAVHITAAFQLAGYRRVIGTLWPINDAAAVRMADGVYSFLTEGGTRAPRTERAAHALHHATRLLRADYRTSPTLWAAYIHVGS